jgi:hypothetical protein
MTQLLGYDPKYEGLDPRYPPPPRVHWFALLAGWLAIAAVIKRYAPPSYVDLLQSLVVDARSPFWCDVYVVIQLLGVGFTVVRTRPPALELVMGLLGIAAVVLGIATVFLIRSDLVRHYNEREHAGLVLSGAMTFFFSFVYFQYHLYDIAQRKKRQADTLHSGAYGALP